MITRLSDEQRLRIMDRAGYAIWRYNGKIAESPRQIRHLVRELSAGLFVVNFKLNRVVLGDVPEDNNATVAYTLAFKDVFVREGWNFFKRIEHEGATSYVHFDQLSHSPIAKTAERLTVDRPDGYYAIKGNSVVGPYQLAVEQIDAMISTYSPALFEGIVAITPVDDSYVFTEFGPGRGGVITDGATDKGVVIAFIPAHPYSTLFGRLSVIAPDMFELIAQMSAHQTADPKLVTEWVDRARLIVGHVNS